jgi:hypothetical protein
MVNPIELIGRSRSRLARLAVERTVIAGAPMIAVMLALGGGLDRLDGWVWQHWGLLLAPEHATTLRIAVFAAAGLATAALAVQVGRAWRRNHDFEQAAERVDTFVGARQEVLTLAMLSDPARPAARDRRSPLFSLLWQRAIIHLEHFDPQRAFRLAPAEPLKRAALFALVPIVALGLAMFALMQLPGPVAAAAERLRNFADDTAATRTPSAEELAEAVRDVAGDINNPRLPPQQKLAELEAIKRQIERVQATASARDASGSSSGQGQGNASGTGSGNGSGNRGPGESKDGTGDKGQGAGNGAGGKGDKGSQQRMSLKNDLAKAQAELEEESNSKKSQAAQNQQQNGSGVQPQAGANPHRGGPQPGPNGSDNFQLQQPGKLGLSSAAPSARNPAARKDDKGTQGDTRLGDFPKAVAYERYYKPGDKGPPLDLKDARYVTFRLPPAVVSGGSDGRTLHDSGAPAVHTPYTNAPLKEEPLAASPDEEQLLPPRYRDLIR